MRQQAVGGSPGGKEARRPAGIGEAARAGVQAAGDERRQASRSAEAPSSGRHGSGSPGTGPGAVGDRLHGAADLGELPLIEDVEEVVRDPTQVRPGCGPQAIQPGLGEDRLGASGI